MGRKIPGKKHRGVKDPIKQQAQRNDGLKKKINAPPTNPDDQPIPRSLQNLILLRSKLKNGVIPAKRKTKNKSKRRFGVNEKGSSNEVKNMKKNPGESSRSFMLRVNQAVHGISNSKGQMEKFKMGLDSDDEDSDNSRKRKVSKFSEFDGPKKRKKSEVDPDGQPKMSRAKKWIMRKEMKQQKKLEESESNYAPKVDHFKFGEVVHEPPSFTAKPRKAQNQDGAPRPGRKNLLLSKLLMTQPEVSKTIDQDHKIGSVNKAGKRKDLPLSVRQQLEQSQQEAIQAYRALKKAK